MKGTNDLGLDAHNLTDESYPPKVIVTKQAMVEHIGCKNNGCVALGAGNQDAIFIADSIDLRSVNGKGILFHEIAHALQNIQFVWTPHLTYTQSAADTSMARRKTLCNIKIDNLQSQCL